MNVNLSNATPIWQEKLDLFIQNKLVNPASPNRKRWVNRDEKYLQTHTTGIVDILEREIGALTDLRVVDLGCGSGLDAINLARCGALVTGVETVPELIEIAGLRAESEQVSAKFCALDQPDKWNLPLHYDAAIAVDVLEHVEQPEQVIGTCFRILRPGGVVILTTPNRWALRNILADPHWRLFGVTLLPRRWSEFYVCSIRRVMREYDMTEFVDLSNLRKLLVVSGLVSIDDSVTDAQRKLASPGDIAEKRKRVIANLVSSVAKIKPINSLLAWMYCYLFVDTWIVVARKPVLER